MRSPFGVLSAAVTVFSNRRRVIIEMTGDAQRLALEAYGPFLQDSDRLLSLFDADQLALIADFVRRTRALLATHTARVREQLADRRRDPVEHGLAAR